MLKTLISGCIFLLVGSTFALDLELTQGINSALPIAINSFGTDKAASDLTSVINNDLRLSGQFRLVTLPGSNSDISGWRQAGADSVLKGQLTKSGYNRYDLRVELFDVAGQGRSLFLKNFSAGDGELRSLAHHISDLVYEKLIGERGIFSTKIAYVLVQRIGGASRYSLEIADADGYNPQSLMVSSEPILSPSWAPNGKQLAFVSFEKRKAQIFLADLATGKRRLVTDFSGINSAPAWSPDNSHLAVVLSKSGTPKIYSVDLTNGALKQLTFGESIDTEPRYSPDGRYLLFTSGRGGSPQVYKLSLADGNISRVSYDGRYNAKATYTPDQKHIVFMHREEDNSFNIGVQDLESGQTVPITSAAMDESPSISPNGRLILYATRRNNKGVLGIVSMDGHIHLSLPAREGDVQEPAWSPYL